MSSMSAQRRSRGRTGAAYSTAVVAPTLWPDAEDGLVVTVPHEGCSQSEIPVTLRHEGGLKPSPWDSRVATQRRERAEPHGTAEVSGMSPVPMDHHEKMRLRAAAFRVTRLYPGPVGELLSRELLTWEEFGYRLGGGQLVMRLVDHVLKAPLAQGDAA